MKQFDQERFRETFDCIQAPSGTVQEVFTMAHTHRKTRIRPILCTALIALLALSATAAAASLFSSLDADELTLNGIYQGDGIITVEVENLSGKQLDFQPCLKLMEWYSGQEVPAAGDVRFTGTSFGPHSSGVMTVDLSAAYDISALEQPSEARYYLVLTNNRFSFGQDWHCSVSFCAPLPTSSSDSPAASEPAIVQGIPAEFQDYFSNIEFSPAVRCSMNDAYAFLYGQLIPFSQLEPYLIWENDTYLCYEVHHLIYSGLRTYVENWLEWNPEVSMDDALWARVQAIYDYYTHPSGFIDPK